MSHQAVILRDHAPGLPQADEALFAAAERGDVRALKQALRPRAWWRRANPNVRNADGWTPLHQAAAYGHAPIVRLLLESGAKVEPRNFLGLTPLEYAACYGHHEVAEALVARGARHTLHTAAALGILWPLVQLTERHPDLNAYDYFGYSALHWAARYGQYEVAQFLLRHGADPGICDVNGESALHRALTWGHDDVAHLLRQSGAPLECHEPE